MPEKYALYKNSFYSKYCKLLNRRQALTNEKYQDYLNLLQELISKFITKDPELLDLYESVKPRDAFADKEYHSTGPAGGWQDFYCQKDCL